jgi:hypothetical protein
MLFFYVKNLLLNVVFNNAPILKNKNFILLKEVMEVLYNILVYRGLYFLYLSNKVLLYTFL